MGQTPIQREEVEAAQASWGQAVLDVGSAESWEVAHARAQALAESHYQIDNNLLFCPTRASQKQFRRTLREVVSYFVGRDADHPEDGGFALEPWVGVRFENFDVVSLEGSAIAMGNYYFARADGSELKVEYSFVYVRTDGGKLKIQLHHSALPYQAN